MEATAQQLEQPPPPTAFAQDAAELQAAIEQAVAEVSGIDLMGAGEGRDEDEQQMLRFLRRRGQIAAELVRVNDQHEAMVRELGNRLKGLDYQFLAHAESTTRRLLAARGGKTKSIKTPFGTVGFRASPDRIEILDEKRAIAAAEGHDRSAELIHVKLEISKTAVMELVKSSGELLDGCELKPGENKFFAK